MSKILKNTTLTDIELKVLGVTIPASGQITVQVEDYNILASEDSITEITSDINSGNIVINDGSSDLSTVIGLAYINFPNNSSNILYDNSGGDLTSATLEDATTELANRQFGKEFIYEEEVTFNTTSNSNQTVVQRSGNLPAGTYRLSWSFTTTNSKSNTDNITEVVFNNTTIFSRNQVGEAVNSINSFKGDASHAGGTLDFLVRTRRNGGNGQVNLSNVKIECWRIS